MIAAVKAAGFAGVEDVGGVIYARLTAASTEFTVTYEGGWVAALPVNYPLAIEDRKRRQREFVAILDAAVSRKTDRAETKQRLQRLLTAWETGRSPAYQAFAAQVMAENLKLAANIVNMATPAQRETLNRRAQRWVDDMNALAARPPS